MRPLALSQDQRGFAGVEFAFIAPVLVVVFIAVFDLGMGFFRRMQVQTAAQRGAIYATVYGFDASGISSAITGSSGAPSPLPAPRKFCGCPVSGTVSEVTCGSTCTVAGSSVAAGVYVSSAAQATYTPILKFAPLASSMTFQTTQVVRIQ